MKKINHKTNNRFTLFDGEKVILTTGLHWINLIIPTLMSFLFAALLIFRCMNMKLSLINILTNHAVIPSEYQRTAALTGALLLFIILMNFLVRIAITLLTRYFITDKRVIITSGLLTIRLSEMLLDRCETVTLSQNILERILDTGDIMIISAGSSLILKDVPEVNSFRMQIIEASETFKKNK